MGLFYRGQIYLDASPWPCDRHYNAGFSDKHPEESYCFLFFVLRTWLVCLIPTSGTYLVKGKETECHYNNNNVNLNINHQYHHQHNGLSAV